jgi:hypothetical protein
MLQEDVSVASPAEEKPKPAGVLGFFAREAKAFLQDPLSYALDRFFYCLLLGVAISILVWGVRFLLSAVVSSVS